MKRIPRFWRLQKVGFKKACELVELMYKETVKEMNGNKVMWVKLLSCKDDKKRKQYISVIGNLLQNLIVFCDNYVFDADILRRVLGDIVREAVRWYNKYFTFTVLGNVKVFEIFESWVSSNYGSVDRYLSLCDKRVKIRDKEGIIFVKGVELRKVGGLYTF